MDKREAKAELANDAEYQAKKAARQAHLDAQAEAARIEREDALQARQGPAAAVARVMAERLGDVAGDVLTVLAKADGRATVVAALEAEVARQAQARDAAARADRAASLAAVNAATTERARARQVKTKRRAAA
ncbi:hypothetical protein [Methylobacterium aerolatum]|uniref:Uncharacterized protein n=1 Tax=Methylobacterium aerolatum TaxID=418708 RepID=A0ABU0I0E5_9HYPH|nr:hypothetical protein [Methylobacterium aerolatum]MDQ0448050.1 hypothetical protein [Methylobacterium aerolatum]